jgi:NAD(P)-dependent dehydrogenase (short-subunit alcohol dehydrogenase family)
MAGQKRWSRAAIPGLAVQSRALLQRGTAVLVSCHGGDASGAQEIVSDIRRRDCQATACGADVSDERSVVVLFDCTQETERKRFELIPYGRVGETEDIAKVACFLAPTSPTTSPAKPSTSMGE